MSKQAADPFQSDPELIAMDILGREGPEADRGYNGRSQVSQVQSVALAKAYLDTAAKLADREACLDEIEFALYGDLYGADRADFVTRIDELKRCA